MCSRLISWKVWNPDKRNQRHKKCKKYYVHIGLNIIKMLILYKLISKLMKFLLKSKQDFRYRQDYLKIHIWKGKGTRVDKTILEKKLSGEGSIYPTRPII